MLIWPGAACRWVFSSRDCECFRQRKLDIPNSFLNSIANRSTNQNISATTISGLSPRGKELNLLRKDVRLRGNFDPKTFAEHLRAFRVKL